MDTSPIIQSLEAAGYSPVYISKAEPNKINDGHMHPFEVRIVVVEGELEIEVEEVKIVLRAKDMIDIPEYTLHRAVAGPLGTTYVVAERHS